MICARNPRQPETPLLERAKTKGMPKAQQLRSPTRRKRRVAAAKKSGSGSDEKQRGATTQKEGRWSQGGRSTAHTP